ncbi:MAG: glutamyl-tRNA reductase [Piscirickettsiaceae bacterium]|nr:glutamyl-tRNA reductase [Piscirickettsiaceae bacterium]
MQFVIHGISHNTAPIKILESITFNKDILPTALNSLKQHPNIIEAVVISTCNRTEIYCHFNGDYDNIVKLWLHKFHDLAPNSLTDFLYEYEGSDAIRHLLCVACGLDSMILGEPQILGQLKSAYNQALNANTLGKYLGRLFQHAFTVAKLVRTDTSIGNSSVSVAFAAVSLAKQIFSDLADLTALLIGAGETIKLTAQHLRDNGINHIIIANRTIGKARDIASQVHGYPIRLDDIPLYLEKADIVISSTASQLPILDRGLIQRALKKRKRRPIFMIDIAVPRDIEPEVGNLEDIYLYCVDDLHRIVEKNLQSRRNAAQQAGIIIDNQVENFVGWLKSQDAVPVICSIRANAKLESEQLLIKALKQLDNGALPEQVMRNFARSLTNRLLHEPSRQLNQSGLDIDNNLIDVTRRLFNIKD